jgi:hypothetical protein
MVQALYVATVTWEAGCQVSVSSSGDLANPAGTESCSGSEVVNYGGDSRLMLDETRSLISSSVVGIEIHSGDRLFVKITAVK